MPQNSSLNREFFAKDRNEQLAQEKEFSKIQKQYRGNTLKFLQGQQEEYFKWYAKTADEFRLKELKKEMEATEYGTKAREEAEKKYLQNKLAAEKKAVAIVTSIEAEGWRSNYGKRDREITELREKRIKAAKVTAQAELQADLKAAAGREDSVELVRKADKKYRKAVRKAQEEEWKLKKDQDAYNQAIEEKLHNKKKKNLNAFEKATKKVQDAEKKAAEERQKFMDMKESGAYTDKEMEDQAAKARQADADAQAAAVQEEMMQNLQKNLNAVASAMANIVEQAFHDAENIMTTYQSHMNARLQGSSTDFKSALDMAVKNTAVSMFVQTKDILESMKELNDQGVAYNLEQRAFLATISDKIANTFDAFDSNLSRLIRLQQADTTAARLGMEASLTKMFNSMFSDTSYLTSLSKAVSGALIDAQALMEKNAATEFEYVVQKWLGSLSALGMSDSAITAIAEGLNQLGTGDAAGLASNSALQTLFAMSSANAGLEYSDLLLNGLTSSTTNKLLKSMVTYLKTIAEGSENQVVRSAYGNIFNMSQSDFAALANLTEGDISTISSTMMSYSSLNNELTNQFAQLTTRMSTSEMLSNITENALFGLGKTMVSDPVLYATNKMLDTLDALGVEINIPHITAMGTGIGLEASVNQLLRLGAGGLGAMGLIATIISGLGSAGGLNLDSWGGTEYTTRGSGMALLMSSMVGGSSGTTYVASGNSDTMSDAALSSATDDAEETKKITNKNAQTEYTFDDFYKAIIGESHSSYIVVQDTILGKVFDDVDKIRVRDDILEGTISDGILTTLDGVKTDDGALLVKISNTNDLKTSLTSGLTGSVTLGGSGGNGISELALISAIRKAFSDDESKKIDTVLKQILTTDGVKVHGSSAQPVPVEIQKVAATVTMNVRG